MSTQLANPEIIEDLEEDLEDQVAEEPPVRVLVHNDEVTPYDFVVHVLRSIFGLSTVAAELVTFAAHTSGTALVAVLPKSVARRRVGKAHFAAQLEGYPLTFSLEQE